MRLEPGHELATGRFLDLESADVGIVEALAREGVHVLCMEAVLNAVDGEESTLAASLHETVAAAIFTVRDGDRTPEASIAEMCAHEVAEHAVVADRRHEAKIDIIGLRHLRHVERAAAHREALHRMHVLAGRRQVVKSENHIHTGGADDEKSFHNIPP